MLGEAFSADWLVGEVVEMLDMFVLKIVFETSCCYSLLL